MAKYRVKFSLYGKNMQTVVEAASRLAAMNLIKEKIVFCEVREQYEPMEDKDINDFFGGIFK